MRIEKNLPIHEQIRQLTQDVDINFLGAQAQRELINYIDQELGPVKPTKKAENGTDSVKS